MFRFMKKVSQSMGLSYPDQHLARIQNLKHLAEEEIETVIDDLLTNPQTIVGTSHKMTLGDAVKEAIRNGSDLVEVAAPLLTFPRATKEQWNGDIDHVDTITGTYFLFTGNPSYISYGKHLLTSYKGAPRIVPSLKKALGDNFNITMVIDAHKSPACRFVIIVPESLSV
jgi:hypothetical protein